MASSQQMQSAVDRILGLSSHLRASALKELEQGKETRYDLSWYDNVPMPPKKDDSYLVRRLLNEGKGCSA